MNLHAITPLFAPDVTQMADDEDEVYLNGDEDIPRVKAFGYSQAFLKDKGNVHKRN